jgi:hypothetical protein
MFKVDRGSGLTDEVEQNNGTHLAELATSKNKNQQSGQCIFMRKSDAKLK